MAEKLVIAETKRLIIKPWTTDDIDAFRALCQIRYRERAKDSVNHYNRFEGNRGYQSFHIGVYWLSKLK